MKSSLRVAVADDEPLMRMYLEEILPDMGHEVVASAEDGLELIRSVRVQHPDLVITDVRMPRMDGVQALRLICGESLVPAVCITGFDERDRLANAESECILVYLKKPVGEAAIGAAIELVMDQFQEFGLLRDQEPDLKEALVHRRDVERAKAHLCRELKLAPREAFEHLREMADTQGVTLVDAARAVLDPPE